MATKLLPMGDYLLVRPDPIELASDALGDKITLTKAEIADAALGESGYQTAGGLIIPATEKEQVERKPLTGVIVGAGAQVTNVESLKEGTRVLFGWHAGWPLESRFEEYDDCIVLYERDVLAIVLTD